MATTYPILLVHGIMLKDTAFFKAFGHIESILRQHGYTVFTAPTDGFGTIETNALQLKRYILRVLKKTGADRVNLIAHSKGGLDSRYMIDHLGMSDKVASVTFLCTPHYGSQVATKIYALPRPVKRLISAVLDMVYHTFGGDCHPNSLEVCRQLSHTPEGVLEHFHHDGIFMQSYSTAMENSRDDFVMGIPWLCSRHWERDVSDGLVSQSSSRYAEYRGHCTEEPLSHSQIVDFMVRKNKKNAVYAFYLSLCRELEKREL
ncbi:MAG: hypothetical protein IJY50_05420 [Clostridia bacterium]|nr:hypothetical protein [Clostridia bacterium]